MMDEHRQQKIIGILEHNDSNSVPFFETKKQLLENGYSEKEIVLALYSFPYDGKPNAPKEENPLTKWYNEHPERADKVAKTLATRTRKKRTQQILCLRSSSGICSRYTFAGLLRSPDIRPTWTAILYAFLYKHCHRRLDG
jgi:site-specific recombinase